MVRAALQAHGRLNRGPRKGVTIIPAASVVAASAFAVLPIVAHSAGFPDFGFLMLIAWRLLRAELWTARMALPLGAFNDLVAGHPFGQSMALWTLAFLLLDAVDSRLLFRDFWLDWLLAPAERWLPGGALVAAELRLVLRQRRWWWWLALLVVFGVQAFGAPKGMSIAVIFAWLLLIDVFARLVLREQETRTAGLVFTATAARLKLPVARLLVSIGLAWVVTLPAMLRMASSEPTIALGTLVVGASIALWGMAIGAVSRNGRPFELALLAVGYGGMQGAALLNVIVAPPDTLRWHLLALPIALVVLILATGFTSHRREGNFQ